MRAHSFKPIKKIALVLLIQSLLIFSMNAETEPKPENLNRATFGGGCFWCVEAVFQSLKGVYDVTSGYAGGRTENPTYEQVTSGRTGHAEVVQVEFDPEVIRFEELLEVFWAAHDPTTLNRQGADVGTHYRSIILYHDEEQKRLAEKSKEEAASQFEDPIVTEIVPLKRFYRAEDYHQNYFLRNPNAPYCAVVIQPKLKKLKLDPAKPAPLQESAIPNR
jgi:peptide-methionine (S)-S-oxide reductase